MVSEAFNFAFLTTIFGDLGDRQFGMGYGALLLASSFLFLFTQGIAARGAVNGDVFVVSAIGGIILVVTVFVFFPIAKMLVAAFITEDGMYSVSVFAAKFFDDRIWGLGCLRGMRCGVAWNSLFLAIVVGVVTTALGLMFALIVTRSGFRYKTGAAGADCFANHHTTFRNWSGADLATGPFWCRHCFFLQIFLTYSRRVGSMAFPG